MNSVSIKDILPFMNEAFDNGKAVVLPVVGVSMSPLLRNRIDSVVLKRIENVGELKKYDIPLYLNNEGKYALHRIIKVHNDTFDMCGDNQTKIEKNVPKENAVAVAVAFTRDGRNFTVKNKRYKMYSYLWCHVIPLRGGILKLNYAIRGRKSKKDKQVERNFL